MSWPLRYSPIVAFAFFAIGCSEKAEGPPTGPEFHTVVNTSSSCDVGHISQLANSFFKQPRQGTVKNLVDLLATETFYTVQAKNTGFDIMAQMEGAVNDATSGDPAVGSDLMNHLLLCMYNPTTEALSYPETFPESFTVSLTQTASAHGAFGQRSGTSTSPIYSRPYSAPFTGVAPPQTGLANPPVFSWASVLVDNDPARVVFYGFPSGDPSKPYDWRSIPHKVNVSPYVLVGFCVDQATDTTAMVVEQSTEGTTVLAFADAYFLNPLAVAPAPGACSGNLALLDGTNPFQLAHRLIRFGTDLVTPRPLMAAVLSPGGVGSKTKCCSKFGFKPVPSVSAALSNVTPNRIKVNTQLFSITATAKSGNDPVNGTKVTLSTTVNSGTNSFIRVAPSSGPCSSGTVPEGITGTGTNPAGTVVFNNLCFTNTGNIYILGLFNVEDRKDAPVTVKSNKINVIP